MTISGRTIAKNAGVLMTSQFATWGLSFLLNILQPRYLGPQGIGELQLATSLWAIVAVIATLGTDMLLTKEIARSPSRMDELLGTTLALRAMIFSLGTIGMVAYVWLAGYPTQTVSVIWIVGIAFLIAQVTGIYEAALKGVERMEYISLAAVLSTALQTALLVPLLLLGYGVITISTIGIITNIATLGILFYSLRKLYPFKLSVNWRLIRSLLQSSLPYFLVTVGIVLYHQVDTVIFSFLADEKTIGWYSVAGQLFGTLLFIPNVFMAALFPALSRAYADSKVTSRRLAQKSLNLLVLIGVPIGLGIMVIANPLVILLFGADFAKSGPILAIRGVLLIMTYMNMLVGFLLISMDRQKAWAMVILAATVVTIPLDFTLIPWTVKTFANGALGGALSFAFTELGMTIAGFALLPKGSFNRENVKVVSKVILAGLVMVGVTWTWRKAFIPVPIAIGAVTYAGMIVLLRAIPKEDWDFFISFGSSFFQRMRGRFSKTVELEG